MPKFSGYDDVFIEAFGRGVEELPEDKTRLVRPVVDPVYKPYVVLVRNRRVDIAGPFTSDGVALGWVARWSEFTDVTEDVAP
jgi:hypothetical protein